MKKLVGAALAAVLFAVQAHAAGTSIKSAVSPLVDTCGAGHCDWNFESSCVTNADCNFGSVSAKSKFSLTGAGRLIAKLTGVTDASASPASGDYVLYLVLAKAYPFDNVVVTLKVPLVDGKGSVDLDLATLIEPAGEPYSIAGSTLYGPPLVPADCAGGNSIPEILARQPELGCLTGRRIGVVAIEVAGKGGLKSNIAPLPDFCDGSACHVNADVNCTTNADCSFGTLSPKSKFSWSGAGRMKLQVSGVVDAAGAPVTGTYHFVASVDGSGSSIPVSIEVLLNDGKGKADVELGSVLPTVGGFAVLGYPYLFTTPDSPADCPSGNDPATIVARAVDVDCQTGVEGIGVVGVQAE